MAEIVLSTDHDCEGGGAAAGGAVALHQAARSACHGAVLAEGGTDETGYTCTECSQPTTKVMGQPTAHWTCHCGTRRSQVITLPIDEVA